MGGFCVHENTATEKYQNPGVGTTCGAATFHVVDVPEKVRVLQPDGSYTLQETGGMLPREVPDPHCPAHGGTPDPDNPSAPAGGGDVGEGLVQAFALIRQHASNLAITRGELSLLQDEVRHLKAAAAADSAPAPAAPPSEPPAKAAPAWADAAAMASDAVNAPPAGQEELSHGPRPGWGQLPQDAVGGGQQGGEGA